MAEEEHLDILKQGVNIWNEWRENHKDILPDLSGADLSGRDLKWVDFSGTYLAGANLAKAKLNRAEIAGTDFREAILSGALFIGTKITSSHFSNANLSGADLMFASIHDTHFDKTNFTEASVGFTELTNVNLFQAIGLDSVRHGGPSEISISTIYASKGKISEIFLRRAGVPEPFITNMSALVGAMSPIQFYSCFISYSTKDQEFAERLLADLQQRGVRCWFAPHDIRPGAFIRDSIDQAIRQHDKLLLILSQHSVESNWVRFEVEAAMEKEDQHNTLVLFPLRLDETVMTTTRAWAADIRRSRHIGDFRRWKEHDAYQQALTRLLRDLKAEAE